VFGMTTFSTHTPTVPVANSCGSDTGTARVYNVRYDNASPRLGRTDRSAIIRGGGLPPSPVAGKVILDNGSVVPFIIGADPDSPLQGRQPPETPTKKQSKSLTYWFIER